MNDSLPKYDIVLLGAGHTNAEIVRRWRMHALPDTRLTCVTDQLIATYSGMLSGTLAGQYDSSRMQIDLVRLCASCNVRLVRGTATGLDTERRLLLLQDRPAVRYDAISIGIGSRPRTLPADETAITIKPMQTFLPRLEEKLQKWASQPGNRTLRIVVVGSGVAGVEISLCLPHFVEQTIGSGDWGELAIVESCDKVLPGMPRRTQELALRALTKRHVQLNLNSRVASVSGGRVLLESGSQLSADLVIWATSATAPEILSQFGLPVDERGFLLTRDSLQSVGNDTVFAVGDSGTLQDVRLPKAGVYAVRQAPVLWENLGRLLRGEQLQKWRPQKQFLTLINSGDGQAIATYHGRSAHAGWCWRLKDWIDSRFMDKYQDYRPPVAMSPQPGKRQEEQQPIQCGGCGSKAPAVLLEQCLPAISNPSAEHVVWGVDPPDDVALVEYGKGDAAAITTDFFSAFVDDPYLMGRIAALNALSDLYAKGVEPRAALSIAILPPGPLAQQRALLNDLLAGAAREFQNPAVPIVGGHTIVGPKLTFGFTLFGDAVAKRVMRKTAPSSGDCLVLTKPLGIGVLLAAHMRAACPSDSWEELIHTMLESNLPAALVAQHAQVSAATDVTGFGLAGHLLEMLGVEDLVAEVSLSSIPMLTGAAQLFADGIESTLAPSNRDSFNSIDVHEELTSRPEFSVLFDPQTSGGLLLAVSEQQVETLLAACGRGAARIGHVAESQKCGLQLRLVN